MVLSGTSDNNGSDKGALAHHYHEQEQEVKGNDNHQWFSRHQHDIERIMYLEILNVVFDKIGLAEQQHSPPGRIKIRLESLSRSLPHRIRRFHSDITHTLRQHDLHSGVIDHLIVVDVVNESHFHRESIILRVEKLETRHIIPQHVVGLPAAEQREPRPQLNLHRVRQLFQVTRADIADLVAIIDVPSGRVEHGREALHRRDAVLHALVVVTRERALQFGAAVVQIDRFLDGDISPVGDLDVASETRDGDER